MVQVLKEVTVWQGDCQPNHTYLVDGDKILALKPLHGMEVKPCSGKLKLDRRGRKFEKFEYFEIDWPNVKLQLSNVVIVKGSKGDEYSVNLDDQTCSCPAFKFRGGCKHVAMAMV